MSDQSIFMRPPPPPSRPPVPPPQPQPKLVDVVIDGQSFKVPDTWTILDACRSRGIDIPTLCFVETLTPANVCRVCVVEVAGARVLVPACSRRVEAGMDIGTDSPRVRLARKMVLEFLASSVDLSTAPNAQQYASRYGARPERYVERHALSGRATIPIETVAQPVKIDNDLYVGDYSKCILCYKCVQACGSDAQNTFAIAVAGRGFDARISTEADVLLPDSACVYCGNCIGVCPTGALMFKSEFDMRKAGDWDETKQKRTDTICPYCGVGCTLTLHIQDKRIVKVTSPLDAPVTNGNLCIKGRFGFEHVHPTDPPRDNKGPG
jgi:predicted molibdopterin-dependent oxidoreductase YjgC